MMVMDYGDKLVDNLLYSSWKISLQILKKQHKNRIELSDNYNPNIKSITW